MSAAVTSLPFELAAGQSAGGSPRRAMSTARISSSTVTEPLPSQSPLLHATGGVGVGLGVDVAVGVGVQLGSYGSRVGVKVGLGPKV